jgi:hypothetical protein
MSNPTPITNNTEEDDKAGTGAGTVNDKLYAKSQNATLEFIKSLHEISSKTSSSTSSSSEIQEILMKKIPNQLLTLKETQRALCLNYVFSLQSNIQQKRKDVESQSLLLQNLIYEKYHLEREIKECEQGFDDKHLLIVAKQEMGLATPKDDVTAATAATADKNATTATTAEDGDKEESEEDHEAIINSYLKPPGISDASFSYRNPSRFAYNTSRIHKESNSRQRLLVELTNESKRKRELLIGVKDQDEFLDGIPNKIKKLEDWSVPLQEYFQKQMPSKYQNTNDRSDGTKSNTTAVAAGGVELMIGSERRNRLRDAKELSGPLYTLFLQFQSYLDAHCTKKVNIDDNDSKRDNAMDVDGNEDKDGNDAAQNDSKMNDVHDWKLHIIDCSTQEGNIRENKEKEETGIENIVEAYTQCDDKAVQLWIPIPNISILSPSSSSKNIKKQKHYVKIQFEYISKLQLVTAYVIGGDSKKKEKDTLSLKQLLWRNYSPSSQSHSQLLLLHNLFENDNGMDLPHGSAADLCFGVDEHSDRDSVVEKKDEALAEASGNDGGIAFNDESIVDYDLEEDNDDGQDPNNSLNKDSSMKDTILDNIHSKLTKQPNSSKPYNWCQYLAGLHYPRRDKGEKETAVYRIDPTTKSTMIRMSRRIRSHATLCAMLKLLMTTELPNPIPVHPSMESYMTTESASRKISTKPGKWTEDMSVCDDVGEVCKYYNVTLTRKSKSLNIRVKIDPRYPAVPPTWTFQQCSTSSTSNADVESWGQSHGTVNALHGTGGKEDQQPTLYDSVLGKLEADVNTLRGMSRFLTDKDEESYDWILMHQLRVIVSVWDGHQQALENNKNNDNSTNILVQRQRRGRDHRPINLLEFELYKRGL